MSKFVLSAVLSVFALTAVPSAAEACGGCAHPGAAEKQKDKHAAADKDGCPHKAAHGEKGDCCANCTHGKTGEACDGCEKADCPHKTAAKGDKAEGADCCAKGKAGAAEAAGKQAFKLVSVADVSSLLAKKGAVTVLDVNNAQTRSKHGVVAGAKLLTSASQYELSELPEARDSKLIFYCANTKCTASHTAAQRAIEAGYTDVAVMGEGIVGWKAAGKKVETPRS
ncbi:MAG: rhodanese-like domain-containing protein [Myxococcales bacterium]